MNTFLARGTILVMNNNKIESKYPGGINQWVIDNSDLIPKDLIERPSTCTHLKTIVELSGFDNPRMQLDWLRQNTEYICFEESYYYIQGSHSVSITRSDIDNQINEQINSLLTNDTTKMNALKISLDDMLKKYMLDFDKFNYEEMLWFQLTPKTDPGENHMYILTITSQSSLVEGHVYYSLPFFRSILKENKVTDFKNCFFYFGGIKVDGRDSIGFKVDYLNNNVGGFFDYSTTPGTGTGGGGGGIAFARETGNNEKPEGFEKIESFIKAEKFESVESVETMESVDKQPIKNYL